MATSGNRRPKARSTAGRRRAQQQAQRVARRRWLIGTATAAAAVVVVLVVAASNSGTARSGGADLSGVGLEMTDGGSGSLADYRGRPLVVNLFASYCPEGTAEMRNLEQIHQSLGDEVAVLGVNVQDSPDAGAATVDATGVTYDIAVDADGSVFAALGAVTMPSTVFIDADGNVVDIHGGALPADALQAGLDELEAA
jgi:peroxiredoxin